MEDSTPTESHFDDSFIKSSKKEKLLGILNDSGPRIDEHILLICTKVGSKLNALGRMSNFMPYHAWETSRDYKTFIES